MEIGIQYRQCWDFVECQNKVGVEPIHQHADPRILFVNSDQFFIKNDYKFDIIFIDGDHTYGQVIKDIRNARACLKAGGSIVLHDANPPDENHTNPYLNGTVFQAICEIRAEEGWDICTLDDDHGVCVLREGSAKPLSYCGKNVDFYTFLKNRYDILNLRNLDSFKNHFL